MPRYANPFRIAVESFDAHPELSTLEKEQWFESFWDEWNDMTHDGNPIFELGNDQLSDVDEVVDFDNRMEFIRYTLEPDPDEPPIGRVSPEVDLVRERALLLIAAEIVDRTWAAYPETKDALINTSEWADALNRLRLNLPWESITVDFELGSEHSYFERIIRATFSVDHGVVK